MIVRQRSARIIPVRVAAEPQPSSAGARTAAGATACTDAAWGAGRSGRAACALPASEASVSAATHTNADRRCSRFSGLLIRSSFPRPHRIRDNHRDKPPPVPLTTYGARPLPATGAPSSWPSGSALLSSSVALTCAREVHGGRGERVAVDVKRQRTDPPRHRPDRTTAGWQMSSTARTIVPLHLTGLAQRLTLPQALRRATLLVDRSRRSGSRRCRGPPGIGA